MVLVLMLETYTKRKKLNPRNAPYWQKISVGKFIGFYRTDTDTGGMWRARLLTGGERHFKKLGGDIRSEYGEMLKDADKWFEESIRLQNPEKAKYTIEAVVDDYIKFLERRSNDAAYRTRKQLEKHLLPTLGKVELKKLTNEQLESWLDSLVKAGGDPEIVRKSKDSANRVLSMAKAAFNRAFIKKRRVPSDVEWRTVEPFKKAGASRDLFLTDDQVKILIDQATGGLQKLIQAGVYTGARAGELTAVLTSDFDIKNGSLDVDGKTGKRTIYLSDAGIAFFKKITADKLPKTLIFTHDDGAQWVSNNYNRIFRKAVEEAKLPSETVFYSLRHYHISKALVAHIPTQIVAENCGTSIRMIETNYAKFMKKDRQTMMNKVELGI